ncbi:MAG: class I SAM-dependent methyltransferase [Clostridia bacterium]|nr:class I SAM-dependent methyltransferase [Clostridia bacterium]
MPIRIDERLTKIASLVDYGTVADVGCDHGKLGYYLVSTDRASKVIATDISEPSLRKAEELVLTNGCEELMECRLCDGLDKVSDKEAETVIIAGLGGDVISEIICRAYESGKSFDKFILSANTHPEKVREALSGTGQKIVYDEDLECAGKRYSVIKSVKGQESLSQMQIRFGAFYKTSEAFGIYGKKDLGILEKLLRDNPGSENLKEKTYLLRKALGERNENQ